MKTTQEWLSEVKASSKKLMQWLERQYVGEALAAQRINELAASRTGRDRTILMRIALDEAKHCQWVGNLLTNRGIAIPSVSYEGDRYWGPVLEHAEQYEELTAAGHHAEEMRLVRIRALAADEEIDADIRAVFSKILPDEEFHAKAFAALSTPEAIEAARGNHEKGLEALGLTL